MSFFDNDWVYKIKHEIIPCLYLFIKSYILSSSKCIYACCIRKILHDAGNIISYVYYFICLIRVDGKHNIWFYCYNDCNCCTK